MTEASHPHSNNRLVVVMITIALVIAAAIAGASYLVTTTIPQTSTIGRLPTSLCDVPVWDPDTPVNNSEFPFLLMQLNSTAFVCVTYQSPWQGSVGEYWSHYSSFNSTQFGLGIINDSFYEPSIGGYLITNGPFTFRPSANTDNVTVVYQITSGSNSTGFYWGAIPYWGCNSFPLAVGYTASQINASDFQSLAPITCLDFGFSPVSTSVGGMVDITYISL